MFGHNEITGKSYFNHAKQNELLVTSRFFTLQGEGPFRGQPAYFIRLAKCNLACSFCDTYFDSGDWRSFDSLLEESDFVIAEFFNKKSLETPSWAKGLAKKMVLVITGGEPSLQNNLSAFIRQAEPYFNSIQIESNGIIVLKDIPDNTVLVVSPKCLEKNNKIADYLAPNIKMLERADCLKFVMSAPEHEKYKVYSEIPKWAHEWVAKTNKQIFISPMNIYNAEPKRVKLNQDKSLINEVVSFWEPGLLNNNMNKRNHEYAAEYCMRFGFTLNLQIHLFAGLA